ncbi:MAG: hypothetical protein ACTHJR_03130 [Sphingomonas sp.]|uniref:hypothetical protein n=1 Tax=Sphingomonas sp. TaxID=28214 RepID=UPI003F7DAA25
MAKADRDYFLARAKHEREVAITCEDNSVALAHLHFAEEYERRAQLLAPQSAAPHLAALS